MKSLSPPPRATYRLQFTPDFGFAQARAILPYLAGLGISHVYASPVTRARTGSTHGYDVCDPRVPNPELGTLDDLHGLLREARRLGLGWLQDVVPNHLAADPANPFWNEVLTYGRDARWAGMFDIDWEVPGFVGKILLPVLAVPFAQGLAEGRFRLMVSPIGVTADLGGVELPLSPQSLATALADEPGLAVLSHRLLVAAGHEPIGREAAVRSAWDLRPGEAEALATWAATRTPAALGHLLLAQAWLAAWWRTGREVIGYRRFFAIDGLAGVRVEVPEVFDLMHQLVFNLVDAGLIDGLRIDHIDGLRDPQAYLDRLHARVPNAWLLVEKILAGDEDLPASWPVAGTTGYELLAGLVGACGDPRGLAELHRFHTQLFGAYSAPTADLAIRSQPTAFGLHGDLLRLGRTLRAAAASDPGLIDLGEQAIVDSLSAIIARMACYRTYGRDSDGDLLARVVAAARLDRPLLAPAIEAVGACLVRGCAAHAPPVVREVLLRFQQVTGPCMAKGREDTLFYRDTRWIASNEVGADPLTPPIDPRGLVALAVRRGDGGLNPGGTHDTKRSEDVRSRLIALTWMPQRWQQLVQQALTAEPGEPHRADQYFALQTIIGSIPWAGSAESGYRERLTACLRKSLREAGQRTTWTDPDACYEEGLLTWVDTVLDPVQNAGFAWLLRQLLADLRPLAQRVSLVQVALRCCLPGVPDIYQGTELEDLSLVDPDNRRPVDFAARAQLALAPVPAESGKLELLRRCLGLRMADADLWRTGVVHWLLAAEAPPGVFAFARVHGRSLAVVLASVPGASGATLLAHPLLSAEERIWHDAEGGTEVALTPGMEVDALLLGAPFRCLIAG